MTGVITVNYNSSTHTKEFLESLARVHNSSDAHVYIADASDTKEPFSHDNLPFQVYIESVENKGYAHGVNQGIQYFQSIGITKYCAVNNDIYFDSRFLDEIEATFEHHDIFGGKIYYAKGCEYHKDRYRKNELGRILWYAGGILDWNNVYTRHRGVDEVDRGQYDTEEHTEFITGCLICFTRTVVKKIGLWDERYFLYYEDADYCERAKRQGFTLFYNPKIIIWHKNAQSTGGPGSMIHLKHQKANRIRFGLTFAPLRTKLHLVKELISATLTS